MSMYDLVAGDGNQRSRGQILIALLGDPDVGRYRDAWVEKSPETGDPIIAIYTRNGGGNRECYCDDYDLTHPADGCLAQVNADLTAHPLYIRDEDDSFDCTYATFYFRAPEEHRETLAGVAGDPVDTGERWARIIAAIGGGS